MQKVDFKRGFLERNRVILEIHAFTGYSCEEQARRIVSRDEWERADQFASDCLRQRYFESRILLRKSLAQSVRLKPEDIRIEQVKGAKPRIVGAGRELDFNLSHTDHFLAIAKSFDSLVGIDIEESLEPLDAEELAEMVFTETEKDHFQQIHPARRQEYFFRMWTRKEAYSKGVGVGLRVPPSLYSVVLPQLGILDDHIWNICTWNPCHSLVASLAATPKSWKRTC
jgi:phosphopantetheinyl transferase